MVSLLVGLREIEKLVCFLCLPVVCGAGARTLS